MHSGCRERFQRRTRERQGVRFRPAPVPLFWLQAGFAARCAGRRNYRHCALCIGRWRDRQSRINSLGRMNDAVCTIKLLSQWLLMTAAAAGRRVLWNNLRWRCGRGLLIDGLRAARPGISQAKPNQYRRKETHAGEGHDRSPVDSRSEQMPAARVPLPPGTVLLWQLRR